MPPQSLLRATKPHRTPETVAIGPRAQAMPPFSICFLDAHGEWEQLSARAWIEVRGTISDLRVLANAADRTAVCRGASRGRMGARNAGQDEEGNSLLGL